MDKTILIAEDEEKIRSLVVKFLIREGFRIVEAVDGKQALEKFSQTDNLSLVILDVMMPNIDGYEVCRRIREISDIPILILTARSCEMDELDGFECGADEYITKPFSPAILVTRVKNLLRRTVGDMRDYTFGPLELRYRERLVLLDGKRLIMTPREFDLLYYMICNKNLVLTRDQIISTVWNMDYNGDDRTVDTHIKCLRAKLGDFSSHIVTIRKVGYKFEWTV